MFDFFKKKEEPAAPTSYVPDNVSDDELILGSRLLMEAINEGHPPYMEDEKILKVVSNVNLVEKGNEIISHIHQFFTTNCFTPEFKWVLESAMSSDAAEDETIRFYFLGDIIQCFNLLGIDTNVRSAHGTILYVALMHLLGNQHLCTPYTLKFVKNSDLDQTNRVIDSVASIYECVEGCDPFIISTILVNIDSEKRSEYLDLMLELGKFLSNIDDIVLDKYNSFVTSLQEMKTMSLECRDNKEFIATDSEPIELWGIVEPVLDHEDIYDTWTCNVAGVSRRCTKEDIGGIVGFVESEPTNDFNPNAMAVYLHNGKHIGYIREDELDDYRYWSRCKKMPFVGYINEYEGRLSSRIHIIVPKSREFLLKLAGNFFISIKENGKLGLIPNVADMVVPNRG